MMIQEDTYKTIIGVAEGIYTEKRSKFIAIAIPVHTVEEIKQHLDIYQKNTMMRVMCAMLICLDMKEKTFVPMITENRPVLPENLFWDK